MIAQVSSTTARLSIYRIEKLLRLTYESGCSQRGGTRLGLSKSPVSKALKRPAAELDFARIHSERRKHRQATLFQLWQGYREEHPEGYGDSRFCVLYMKGLPRLDMEMRQAHCGGEKLFVD